MIGIHETQAKTRIQATVLRERNRGNIGSQVEKIVYEVYGDYVEGLEADREKILDYFGRDFVTTELKKAA